MARKANSFALTGAWDVISGPKALRTLLRGVNDAAHQVQLRWTSDGGATYQTAKALAVGDQFDYEGRFCPQGQLEAKGTAADTFKWEEEAV